MSGVLHWNSFWGGPVVSKDHKGALHVQSCSSIAAPLHWEEGGGAKQGQPCGSASQTALQGEVTRGCKVAAPIVSEFVHRGGHLWSLW